MKANPFFFDTTGTDRERDKLIDAKVGKAFGIWQRIKLKGIGCSRMAIEQMSEGFSNVKHLGQGMQFGNIELRPQGILLHFNSNLKSYCWPILYHHLNLYSSDFLSIHAEGQFIKFRRIHAFGDNAEFIKRLQDKMIDARGVSIEELV